MGIPSRRLLNNSVAKAFGIGGITGLNALIESIQYKSATFGASTTDTVGITSVDLTKTFAMPLGLSDSGRTTYDQMASYMYFLDFANATNLRATRGGAVGTPTWNAIIIELKNEAVNYVEQDVITITNANLTNTATIDAVGENAILLCTGYSGNGGNIDEVTCTLELTDSTTITATREDSANSCSVGYIIIDPK